MSKDLINLEHTTVIFTSVFEKQHVRVDVLKSHFGDIGWTFYVPMATKDKHGFIPSSIVQSRMKRDFNIKLGHYSSSLRIE